LTARRGVQDLFAWRKKAFFKQARAVDMLAWNNKIGPQPYLLVSKAEGRTNRDS